MVATVNASTSAGVVITPDNSGVLALQSSSATALTIDASQNVGIGTTSPSYKLDVQGTTATQRISSTTGTNAAYQIFSNTGQNFYVGLDNSAGNQILSAAYGATLLGSGAYPMVFGTNNTERMRIDSSGNVGIGTASPSSYGAFVVRKSNTAQGVTNASAQFSDAVNSALWIGHTSGAANLITESSNITFGFTNGSATTERMRIGSGGIVSVGTTLTDNPLGGFVLYVASNNSQFMIGHETGTGSGNYYAKFSYAGGTVGTISQNGTTAVAYNTSSDYRLKENIAPLTGALNKVSQLKPVSYTWKASPEETGEGFIAHELAEVCPQAVTGEKDAVDADGNPQYQGIDTSFLVATLTAAIQELSAKNDALTARIVALEGA
jgi:hypothetical protein